MAGFWRTIVSFLMVEERVAVPRRRQVSACSACRHWVAPDKITAREVPSSRAILWAKDNGYGRCTVKPAKDRKRERGETKRFTQPTDSCGQFEKMPEKAM